ncbi:MAG: hypothetical protein SAK29_00585 [Scytonema sp. PMC 1069.18]|nr:hypothetical protein [Scytonema sp. PMC 1069.18]MEC4887367.1 hypothetical protein [Scytonema sp. PMC 1070.18]
MSHQSEKDLQRRLEQIEAEINTPSGFDSQSQKTSTSSFQGFASLSVYGKRFLAWFKNQSSVGKVVVSGVAIVLGFAVLQAVLKLVTAVISLAVLSILVYLGYKFFVSNNSQFKP